MKTEKKRSWLSLGIATLLLSSPIASAGMSELDRELRQVLIANSEGRGLAYFRLPSSSKLKKIPQDPNNRLTLAKVTLGKFLYHETAMAMANVRPEGVETYSCASCHFAQAGFMNNLPQGIGEGGMGFGSAGEARVFNPDYDPSPASTEKPDIQPIRSPTILNGAYQELMLWNGQFGGVGANNELLPPGVEWEDFGFPLEVNGLGFQGLETQAIAGMDSRVHRLEPISESRIPDLFAYRMLFGFAFPDDLDPITRVNAGLAIAAFERTVLANRAPWQEWLQGRVHAMNDQQKRGAILFFSKANCQACHTGPALNSMTFHAIGMNDLDGTHMPGDIELGPFGGVIPDDVQRGRGGFVEKVAGADPQQDYKFKTPQLYNLVDSPFFGHGSSFATVEDVIRYKNNAIAENASVPPEKLSDRFVPLNLSEQEIGDLVAFVEEALYDPHLMRYVPAWLPSGNCTPVNDPEAQSDLIANGFCR